MVRALQKDPRSTLREVADAHPVHASPADDLIDVTMRMADFNLFTLPVVDAEHKILGVITEVKSAVTFGTAGVFPFGFGRKPIHLALLLAEPIAKGDGIVP